MTLAERFRTVRWAFIMRAELIATIRLQFHGQVPSANHPERFKWFLLLVRDRDAEKFDSHQPKWMAEYLRASSVMIP